MFNFHCLISHSYRTQEFPYTEHYGLVTEHLRILTAQEEGDAGEEAGKKGDKTEGNVTKMGNVIEEDEEWSEGEDEDEEEEVEEESRMTVA